MTEMKQPPLNENEKRVLVALEYGYEEFCYPFAHISAETLLDRKAVRRACRSLKRKGLSYFQRGLMTEDGAVAGAGYGITPDGRLMAALIPGRG